MDAKKLAKKEYDIQYRAANREKRKQRLAMWRKANAGHIRAYNRRRGDQTKTNLFRLIDKYKRSARKRQLQWSLTDVQAEDLFCADCSYCGSCPKVWCGIDRVDNDNGYTTSNCVPACATCNFMKHTLSFGDFVRQCAMITDHFDPVK